MANLSSPIFWRIGPNGLTPTQSGTSLDMAGADISGAANINAGETSPNIVGTAGQTTYFGDGSNLVNVPISIGSTVTGAADEQVLFTNGTTLAQDPGLEYSDGINQLRVGNSFGTTQANAVYSGKLFARETSSSASLGSCSLEYSSGSDTGFIRTTKETGPANTFDNFNIRMTDATFGNSRDVFSVTQTEIVINQTGADYDFRVETDTDPNFLIIDAGANTLAIAGTTAVDSILDEDDLVSDSATALATQQSIKAYVDSRVSIAQLVDSAGAQDFNTAAGAAVTWATQDILDSDYAHVGGTSGITINRTGLFRVTYSLSYDTTANARRTCRGSIQVNSTEVTPSVAYSYARNNTDDNGTTSTSVLIPITSGDVLEVFTQQAGSAGASASIANQSWVTIEFVR